MVNIITAVSDCNARACQKSSYYLSVELVLEEKVCETLCLSVWGPNYTGECRDRNSLYGINVVGLSSPFLLFTRLCGHVEI